MPKEVKVPQVITAIKNKKIKKIRIMENYIGEGVVLIQARGELLKEMFGKNIFDETPEQKKKEPVDMTGAEKDKQ